MQRREHDDLGLAVTRQIARRHANNIIRGGDADSREHVGIAVVKVLAETHDIAIVDEDALIRRVSCDVRNEIEARLAFLDMPVLTVERIDLVQHFI